jgi:hypothetical protein
MNLKKKNKNERERERERERVGKQLNFHMNSESDPISFSIFSN